MKHIQSGPALTRAFKGGLAHKTASNSMQKYPLPGDSRAVGLFSYPESSSLLILQF